MSCPFNHSDSNVPKTVTAPYISLGANTQSDSKKTSKYKEPCRYWSYIHPQELTSLQTGREGLGLNHHDEHLFIIVHQAFELWFKQIIFELDWIRDALVTIVQTPEFPSNEHLRLCSYENVYENYTQQSVLRLLVHRLQRADTILRIATNGFSAMETMETMDFLEFRDYLIPASGFQSLQLRELEILLGIKDEERVYLNGKPYAVQFKTEKDDFTPQLNKRLNEITLKEAVYLAIAHLNITDRDAFTSSYIEQKKKEIKNKRRDIEIKSANLKQKIANLKSLTEEGLQEHIEKYEERVLEVIGIEYFLDDRGFALKDMIEQKTKIPLSNNSLELNGSHHSHTLSIESPLGLVSHFISEDIALYNDTLQHLNSMESSLSSEIEMLETFFYSTDPIIPDKMKLQEHQIPKGYTIGEFRRGSLYLFSNPWTQPTWELFDCSDWSLFLSSLLKMEQAVTLWRGRHARMVELMIGRRQGTGGSSGVAYLDSTQIYRAYEDLWRIRAMLISTASNEYKQKMTSQEE